ncbi:MAG: hypothetical protein FJZ80_08030 [Bacteroidetes bacterium]|nr:hypothetical protein [Bacteroidota bacterium]MBM3424620.1 hypothetical protein [Bacteroidota bacterium]
MMVRSFFGSWIKVLAYSAIMASSAFTFGQQANFFSQSEVGVSLGQMYYIGDLNPYKPFYRSQWAFSLMYRYNVFTRMALRLNYTQGSVEAYDHDARNPIRVNRNLDFQSDIKELAGGIEFYYTNFFFGRSNSKNKIQGTCYLLAQLGVFYMNPTTTLNGQIIELRPLGTEGQGTSLNRKGTYSNFQVCLPLGVGAKAQIGKNVTFNLDIAIRKTFTDYLDDVKAATYADPAILVASNGDNAAILSNRSLDGARHGYRGNPTTRDWYVYTGATVSVRLGSGRRCFQLR